MDDRTGALVARLCQGMDREAVLFSGLVGEVDRLRDAFQGKQWTDSITVAQGLEGHARRIEAAERDREADVAALAAALGLPDGSPLSVLVARLDPDLRSSLDGSGRRLRTAVFRLKTATGRLRYCAETLSGTLERVLAGVFPHRRGRIYSRQGRTSEVGGSLLVDHSL
jgi:hypothetical protein